MAIKTTQDTRLLQMSTPLAKDFLLIERLRCTEGLNQLFHIDLELLHEEQIEGFEPTAVDPKQLLGQPIVVGAFEPGNTDRYFHGLCVSFTQGGRNQRFSKYRAELRPKVWVLTQVQRSRIFQNKTVPDIIDEVLKGFEVDNEIQRAEFKPRNYCVQYRESDWDFISRLMEEEGIFYYFEHTKDNHRLVLGNTPSSHRVTPNSPKVTFQLERSELGDQWIPSIYRWQLDEQFFAGKYELWDFNFQLPTNNLQATQTSLFDVGNNKKLEIYDWPGGYAKRYDGIDPGGGENASKLSPVFEDRERTTKIRQQELDVAYKMMAGTADNCAMTAGYRFSFIDHPTKKNNIDYVVVTAVHDAVQSPFYISEERELDPYVVNFTCIPHGGGHAPFRPSRKTPKPVVLGSQTAFVVGTPGEEIFTDKYGRVKVQFHWDREGKRDERSSCWLRVAQMWAGNGWGSVFIPRIGMEVLVQFIEGDPDQPIIAGCVYNPANMPPYKLPDHKTRSTIKSDSTKGGNGFNEFRFEDKKGEEQIFIHAEKNVDVRVKNDSMETIVRDRHLIVERDQLEKVKRDKHLQVEADHNEKIGGTMSLKVGADLQEKVGSNYALDAGSAVHVKAGASIVIEAGASITLKVGGNFVNIGPSGVAIQGTMVLINSGGAAGSGAGSSPETPKDPKEADKADPGKPIEKLKPPPPPKPETYSTSAVVLQKAAKTHLPFCEICGK